MAHVLRGVARIGNLPIQNANHICKTFVPARNIKIEAPFTLRKVCYDLSGYNQLGLYKDDLIDTFTRTDTVEAVRRLPDNIRVFEIIIKFMLSTYLNTIFNY